MIDAHFLRELLVVIQLPPPEPASAAVALVGDSKPHLMIAMNTIPRKSGDEYLSRTVSEGQRLSSHGF